MNEKEKMNTVLKKIKDQFLEFRRIEILDFIMDNTGARPSFERAVGADVLYALTNLDGSATKQGTTGRDYDFKLPNLDMKIEFKAVRTTGYDQFKEIREEKRVEIVLNIIYF